MRANITAILAAGILVTVSVQGHAAVGATAGDFDVTPAGAAIYHIPIQVPPGTGGVTPELALRYSSQGDNGPIGVGWSITGLSQITRCAATILPDGFVGAVRFNHDDRLCLDGARLVVTSGTYGQNNAQYRTQIEQFKKIVQRGGALDSSNVWFEVHTKDGLIYEYGRNNGAAFTVPGQIYSMLWAVNRISDTLGNYIDVQYAYDTTNNERYLDRIDYTGNINAGLAPYNSVQFEYTTRPDASSQYVTSGSAQIRTTRRLTYIKTYVQSNQVREYRLTYATSPRTGQSQLIGLQECATAGSGMDCLSSTDFTWITGTSGFSQHSSLTPPTSFRTHGGEAIDIDGDGLTDLVQAFDATRKTWINTGNGWQLNAAYELPGPLFTGGGTRRAVLVDVNGDGLPDFVEGYGSSRQAWLNTGSGWLLDNRYKLPKELFGYTGDPYGVLEDLNGDGLPDLLYSSILGLMVTNESWLARDGSCSSPSCKWRVSFPWEYTAPVYPMFRIAPMSFHFSTRAWLRDVNGDGLPDYVVSFTMMGATPETFNETYLNTGENWVLSPAHQMPAPMVAITEHGTDSFRLAELVDVNGDGLPDLVCSLWDGEDIADLTSLNLCGASQVVTNEYIRATYINNGNGFHSDPTYNVTAPLFNSYDSVNRHMSQFLDLTGTGRPDQIHAHSTSTNGTWLNNSGSTCSTAGCKWQLDSNWTLPFNLFIPQGTTSVIGQFTIDGRPNFAAASPSIPNRTYVSGGLSDLITVITPPTSLAPNVNISYTTLLDKARYTRGTPAQYPQQSLTVPYPIVSTSNAGLGAYTYSYENLRFQVRRRSLMGFEKFTRQRGQHRETTQFRQAFPYTGMVESIIREWTHGTKTLTKTLNTLSVNTAGSGAMQRYFPHVSQSNEQFFDLISNTTPLTTKRTDTNYDTLGNPVQIVQQHFTGAAPSGSDHTTTTTSQYTNDTSQWLLGRLTSASVTRSGPHGSPVTREVAFEYHPVTGLLTAEITEPNSPTLMSRIDHTHDLFGNRTETTVSGLDIDPRTTTATWDTRGQFKTNVTNPLGHTESYIHSPVHGGILSLTGPNNLTTTWAYDAFGRQTLRTAPDGTTIGTEYKICNGSPCLSAHLGYLTIHTTGSDGSEEFQTFDSHGRAVAERKLRFGGGWIGVHTEYDQRNRITTRSLPSTTYQYDPHDRVIKTESSKNENISGGVINQIAYNGLTILHTDPRNNITEKHQDATGQTVKIIDALSGVTEFEYDAYGNLLNTTDANSNVTTLSYDPLGRKVAMSDPNMGSWTYEYDVLGELISQTDAKSQTMEMEYDLLGRMVSRTEAEGVSTWIYDTRWIGKLSVEATPSPPYTGGQNFDFERHFYYDNLGRIEETRTEIGTDSHSVFQTYDIQGRPEVLTYPSGFSIRHEYSTSGHLEKVVNDTTGQMYWQLEAMDFWGNIDREKFGNSLKTCRNYDAAHGRLTDIITTPYNLLWWSCNSMSAGPVPQALFYTWDLGGNMEGRFDLRHYSTEAWAISEGFRYDELDRVNEYFINGALTEISYDAIGNITSKSDVGTYTYGQNGAGPNALTEVTGPRASNYEYDANGNVIAMDDYEGQIHWTSFNMPNIISYPYQDTGSLVLYDPNRARYMRGRIRPENGATVTSFTRYIGKIYEAYLVEEMGQLILSEERHYIQVGPRIVAMVTQSPNQPDETLYLHHDHLGSVDTITDENGSVVERYSYDPFGKRRFVDPWAPDTNDTLLTDAQKTDRGYTSHEHLDHLGLIHMNGRVYNPIIGRFISPDPYIPQPYNGQSHNRYSYVLNNPLRYTDPSGYTPEPIEEIVVIGVRRPELRPPSMDFSYLHFSSIPHMPQFGTRSYGRPVNPPLSQQMMYYLYGTIGNFGALTHEGPRMAQGASLDPQQSRKNPPGVDNGQFGGGEETGTFGRAQDKRKIIKTINRDSILYERDGASVLVKNDVLGGGIPIVGEDRISHALDVSYQEDGRRVNIISGYRGPDHPNVSENHERHNAIDAYINGYNSTQTARALYNSGHFHRVAGYPNSNLQSAHGDDRTTHRGGCFIYWGGPRC